MGAFYLPPPSSSPFCHENGTAVKRILDTLCRLKNPHPWCTSTFSYVASITNLALASALGEIRCLRFVRLFPFEADRQPFYLAGSVVTRRQALKPLHLHPHLSFMSYECFLNSKSSLTRKGSQSQLNSNNIRE